MGAELGAALEEPDPAGLKAEMRDAVHVRLYALDIPLCWSKSTISTLSYLADGEPLARMLTATAAPRSSDFFSAFRTWVTPAAVVP